MAITKKDLELIIILKIKYQIDFTSIVTIGRQKIGCSYNDIKKILSKYNLVFDQIVLKNELEKENFYCEPILKILGALHIDVIDVSNYEFANLHYDLNKFIPKQLEENYSLVIDSGSSEHMFDVKTSQKNILSLVKKGGHLMQILPTNNESGHGFYQFSVSFFIELLSSNNGYKILKLFSYRTNSRKIYEVLISRIENERVRLVNNSPTYLFVLSKREQIKEVLKYTCQQQDYNHLRWEGKKHKTNLDIFYEKLSAIRPLLRVLGYPFKSFFFGHRNKKFYKKFKTLD